MILTGLTIQFVLCLPFNIQVRASTCIRTQVFNHGNRESQKLGISETRNLRNTECPKSPDIEFTIIVTYYLFKIILTNGKNPI